MNNKKNKDFISFLKTKTNKEIYDIIISNYYMGAEDWYEVFNIIEKISLKRKYNNMLADFYFKGRSFKNKKPYDVFSKKIEFFKWKELIENNKENEKNYFLTIYNILPRLIEQAKSDEDMKMVKFYQNEINRITEKLRG